MNPDDNRRIGVRLLSLIALSLTTAVLTACGSSKPAPPVGTPERPLVATTPEQLAPTPAGRVNEATPTAGKHAATPKGSATAPKGSADGGTTATKPNYQALVERQKTTKPQSRFTPCNLVTRAQAQAIVGLPIEVPLEAPQGPTCIYRAQGHQDFITVAVQSLAISKLKRQIRQPRTVDVSNRKAYCGTYGQPMLYVPISSGRVLSIAAPCAVAKQFAITAVRRLVN
jgi:hypothetical protein